MAAAPTVVSADLSTTAITDWVEVDWWVKIGLRSALQACSAHIKALEDEHEAEVALARKEEKETPGRPAKLIHLYQQRAVLEQLLGGTAAGAPSRSREGPFRAIVIFVMCVAAAGTAWGMLGWGTRGDVLFEGPGQFVLLTFAIGLGSYFANLVRDLKIRHSRAPDSAARVLSADIRYVRAAEYLVVLLALLGMLRVIASTFPGVFGTRGLTPPEADAGLALLLAALVLYTAVLHVREWIFR